MWWWSLTFIVVHLLEQGSSSAVPVTPETAKLRRKPRFATEFNGEEWPANSEHNQKKQVNFYVIGAWGGEVKAGRVEPFRWAKRGKSNMIDEKAQHLVANRMRDLAERTSGPAFVVNAGGSFYPQGIQQFCDARFPSLRLSRNSQINKVFQNMYLGTNLVDRQWLGVLGESEYGFKRYDSGWVQALYYTWSRNSRWVMPAQYWSRRYNFDDFAADFFFIDNNVVKALGPEVHEGLCSSQHSTRSCAYNNPEGPKNPHHCVGWFQDTWKAQQQWLEEKLRESDVAWQVVVMYHPPTHPWWQTVAARWGIDLIICAGRHVQKVIYKGKLGATAVIMSGGGGGIWSEDLPSEDGQDDAYGFMDVSMSRNQLIIEAHSHGGIHGDEVIRSRTAVAPRYRNLNYVALHNYTELDTIDLDFV